MIARKVFVAAVLAAVQAVSAQAQPPVKQDVEFLRGCWAMKAGSRVLAFLRLLPDGADGPSYQGYIQSVGLGRVRSEFFLAFARDGSTVTVRDAREPDAQAKTDGSSQATLPAEVVAHLPSAVHRVSYAARPGDPDTPWWVADGDGETLHIYPLANNGGFVTTFFQGVRDGCD